MKPFLLFGLFTLMTVIRPVIAPAQTNDNFVTFDTTNGKTFMHGLATVEVVDKRLNKTDTLGIIRAGKMNGKRPLLAKVPLTTGIENYYKTLSLTSKIPSGKKLLVLLYKFDATELSSGLTDENAEFTFAADYLLSDDKDQYQLLGMVDTIIKVSSLDVTKKLLRTIDQSICNLYEHTYTLNNKDKQLYTREEAIRYDDIEKNRHKAFREDIYPDGCYTSWQNFLDLQYVPEKKIGKKKKIFKIETIKESGKIKYSDIPKKTKVIIHEGKPYLSFGNVFYPLIKKENDFYFTGRLSEAQNTGFIVVPGMMFGAVGFLIIVHNNEPAGLDGSNLTGVLYDFKVEARTGKALLLRKILRPKKSASNKHL